MEYVDLHHVMRGDLQAESAGWLFKSPLEGAGILRRLHYCGRTVCLCWGSSGTCAFSVVVPVQVTNYRECCLFTLRNETPARLL